MKTQKKKIVIIGGGFAGVNLAKKLTKSDHFEIILVDKNNYNFFPPLIYQVATGYLETSSSGDNTNYGKVNINCSLSQVGWGDLDPYVESDIMPEVISVDDDVPLTSFIFLLHTKYDILFSSSSGAKAKPTENSSRGSAETIIFFGINFSHTSEGLQL